MPLNEVAAHRRHTLQRADRRLVARGRGPGAVILQEPRPGVLTRTKKNGIGVRGGFLRE